MDIRYKDVQLTKLTEGKMECSPETSEITSFIRKSAVLITANSPQFQGFEHFFVTQT